MAVTKPVPMFVLIDSGPHNGKAVALLLHDYRTGKAWILKWRTSSRAFALHPKIERGTLRPASYTDRRTLMAHAAYERGEAENAIERLRYLQRKVFDQ